ncbi:MAG: bacillithiol system redox-active protein YtxJ [Chitinophagales bacterium]
MNWKELKAVQQVEDILNESQTRPVAIFKHSTRCSVSTMAKRSLESDWKGHENEIVPYFLDLLNHRDVSNSVSEKLNIRHESPQLILIRNGEVLYHAAHASVDFADMAMKLSS